jgi:hypothetical protein
MSRRLAVVLALTVAAMLPAPASRAQETPKPETTKADEAAASKTGVPVMLPPARKPPTLLRAQIGLTRHQGERKLASVPYTVLLTSDGRKVRLRMGVEVPIAVTTFAKEGDPKSGPVTSFQYRNVGTNIDCWAEERGEGLYQLALTVENSSIYTATESRTAVGLSDAGLAPDRPLFRTFNVTLNPTLRDGQSVQTVASTDPVSGEVVKIDVTLNVVR